MDHEFGLIFFEEISPMTLSGNNCKKYKNVKFHRKIKFVDALVNLLRHKTINNGRDDYSVSKIKGQNSALNIVIYTTHNTVVILFKKLPLAIRQVGYFWDYPRINSHNAAAVR